MELSHISSVVTKDVQCNVQRATPHLLIFLHCAPSSYSSKLFTTLGIV